MKKAVGIMFTLAFYVCFCEALNNTVAVDLVTIRAVIGQDAILPCGQKKIFLDGPDAFVSWVKDNGAVIYRFPSESSVDLEGHSNSNEICYKNLEGGPCLQRTSFLLIRVTESDAGEYRCRIHYQGSPIVDFGYELVVVDKPGFPTVYDENGNTMTNTLVGPIPLGANLTLICEVKDDRPSTDVYWEKNGLPFVTSSFIGSGIKRSILRIINASRNEHETRYVCIAQAGDVTPPLKNTLEIKMFLPPINVQINLNEGYDFEAGVPKVIDCLVVGSVPAPTIQWTLDGEKLNMHSHKESPGINITLSTITFVPKKTDNNRVLSCLATNQYLKEVYPSHIRLEVGFRPVCVQTLHHKINIKNDKVEKIVCCVEADPPPQYFIWTFSDNKTVETPIEETPIRNRYKSVLSWIPHDGDIGSLKCEAVNYYGKQEVPCVFDIQYTERACKHNHLGELICKQGSLIGPKNITETSKKHDVAAPQPDPAYTAKVVTIIVMLSITPIIILFVIACRCCICHIGSNSGSNDDFEMDPTYMPAAVIGQNLTDELQDLPPISPPDIKIEIPPPAEVKIPIDHGHGHDLETYYI